MRKILLCASVCFSLLLLGGCNVSEMGSLPELSKPYVCVYECEDLSLGGEEMLDKFEKIQLELEYKGDFTLSFLTLEGMEGEYEGEYEVSVEDEELKLSMTSAGAEKSFYFRMEKGEILLDYNLGGKLLHASFKMP